MNRKIITTEDGSSSIFWEEMDENYHSRYGSVQESMCVFIQAGLMAKLPTSEPLSILEMGFGTGLNALLTYCQQLEQAPSTPIHYTSLEAYPLEKDLIDPLNFIETLKSEAQRAIFDKMHQNTWNKAVKLSDFFTLEKRWLKLEEYTPERLYDIVYFDAFAPSAQPELWTESVFKKMYACLKEGGILTTYCAKGTVKRAMKAAGFKIEALPGPIGKREMTRAIKQLQSSL